MTKLASIFDRGCEAIDAENLQGLRAAIADAKGAGAGDDARVRYLEFVAGWADEQSDESVLEELLAGASTLLEDASGVDDPQAAGRVVLTLSEILLEVGEADDVEHALRQLVERDDLDAERETDARVLLAQVILDIQEDPDEAMRVLQAVPASERDKPDVISLRAVILHDLERGDEAIELLEKAVAASDEIELRYQLGLALRALNRGEEAIEHLLAVRTHDLARHELDPESEVPADQAADLRRHFEDVLDTLPDPVLNLLATASIRVERWVSEDAIRSGCDPRTVLAFEGEPASDADEGKVEQVVLFRDALIAEIDMDEDIPEVFALSLVEEADRFFDIELIAGV